MVEEADSFVKRTMRSTTFLAVTLSNMKKVAQTKLKKLYIKHAIEKHPSSHHFITAMLQR